MRPRLSQALFFFIFFAGVTFGAKEVPSDVKIFDLQDCSKYGCRLNPILKPHQKYKMIFNELKNGLERPLLNGLYRFSTLPNYEILAEVIFVNLRPQPEQNYDGIVIGTGLNQYKQECLDWITFNDYFVCGNNFGLKFVISENFTNLPENFTNLRVDAGLYRRDHQDDFEPRGFEVNLQVQKRGFRLPKIINVTAEREKKIEAFNADEKAYQDELLKNHVEDLKEKGYLDDYTKSEDVNQLIITISTAIFSILMLLTCAAYRLKKCLTKKTNTDNKTEESKVSTQLVPNLPNFAKSTIFFFNS